MKCTSTFSPILRVPGDDTIYCAVCDMIQPAYAHVASGQLYCAICNAPYDPDLIPEDYEPYTSPEYPVPSTETNPASLATRYSVLATVFLLFLLLAFAPRATAQSIKACGDIMANGQSFQQKADAVLTEGAEDPKMPAAMRVHLRLAQQQFDNLCAVDASLDTREAGQFFNEEADRLGRLAAAQSAAVNAGRP